MKIILGSGSPWRKRILAEMGYEFETVSPDIDEKAIRRDDPKQLVLALAAAKSAAIRGRLKEPAILITCDQVVVCGGRILEKPRDEAEAREFIRLGGEHPAETMAAVMAVNTAKLKAAAGVDIAKVWFRPLPAEAVDAIIRKGEIFQCSGGLDVEDPLARPYLIKQEGTTDSILGLPKELTRHLIEEVS